jgi:hypothetical protein
MVNWRIRATEIEEGFLARRKKERRPNASAALGVCPWLFEALGLEAGQFIVLGRIADLDGTAADFAIFDVDLTRNGKIQNHRDFFATVRAHESMFHCYTEC